MTSVIGQPTAGDRNLIYDVCLALLGGIPEIMSLPKQRQPKVLVLSLWETTLRMYSLKLRKFESKVVQ